MDTGVVPALLRVPPPLMFVAAFLAGIGLQRLAPLPGLSDGPATVVRLAGAALVLAGLLVMLSGAAIFLRRRTTLVPFGTAAQLVTSGPYRFTRNPMYLGLALIYTGAAARLGQPWALVLLPLPLVVLGRVVIPFEEARLRARFGEAFQEYCRRVRRWI